jgi:tripartite-type tricarboxylate transporter receptor subunit TctC
MSLARCRERNSLSASSAAVAAASAATTAAIAAALALAASALSSAARATAAASAFILSRAARSFAASTPAELVALARTRGTGAISFAGTGGVVRLAPLMFANQTGIELSYVPYRGSTQAHPDLISGRVDIMFDTVPAALPHIQAGTLKALATTGAARSPQLPDVPTVAEALLPGFEATTWGMVIGPANMAEELAATQSRDIAAALRNPVVLDRHRVLGAEVISTSPAETRAFVQAELIKWGAAARLAGIEPQAAR